MSLEGLIVGLLILIGVLAFVGAPLFRRRSAPATDERLQKQRERLLLVYERVLTNLRDLDEDHSTGKMPTGDYQAEREIGVQRGIQVLKALDQLSAQQASTPAEDADAIDRAIDDQIEQAVAAYRTKAQASAKDLNGEATRG